MQKLPLGGGILLWLMHYGTSALVVSRWGPQSGLHVSFAVLIRWTRTAVPASHPANGTSFLRTRMPGVHSYVPSPSFPEEPNGSQEPDLTEQLRAPFWGPRRL